MSNPDQQQRERVRDQRCAITQDVKGVLVKQLNLDLKPNEIDNDSPLFGSGLALDSVDALELTIGLENKFGIHLDEANRSIYRSVNTIVDHLSRMELE